MEPSKDINLFSQPTKYLDCNCPEIKNITSSVSNSYVSEKKKTKVLFNWVKENIKFEFGYWGIKASDVLKRKVGMCTNKANLLICLLRSVGIPAGYGILKVKTKEFYGELMCPSFSKLVSPKTIHIYVGIFLDKKWIRCDPSVDSRLAKVLKERNLFAKMNRFNITESEIKDIEGIFKKSEFFANIDKELDNPPKHAKGITLEILNSYLKFLRTTKAALKYSLPEQLENNFVVWLQKENIHYYEFMKRLLDSQS